VRYDGLPCSGEAESGAKAKMAMEFADKKEPVTRYLFENVALLSI